MSTAINPIDYSRVPVGKPAEPQQGDRASLRRRVAFVVVIAILIVAAVGLRSTVSGMKLTFRKLPVQPAAPLLTIGPQLGPWLQVNVDRPENPDIEHALGTREYIFRTYLDLRKLPEADRERLVAATLEQREELLNNKIRIDLAWTIRIGVTYYTGSVDTVPHVSERCFVADGWKPSSFEIVTWPILKRDDPAERNVDVRLMNFEDQIGERSFRPRQVCYFFQVNGKYLQDPIFGVRKELQNLFQKHAYFAKVELVTGLDKAADAAPVMEDFLVNAMPDIESVLPDWKAVIAAEGAGN